MSPSRFAMPDSFRCSLVRPRSQNPYGAQLRNRGRVLVPGCRGGRASSSLSLQSRLQGLFGSNLSVVERAGGTMRGGVPADIAACLPEALRPWSTIAGKEDIDMARHITAPSS